MRTPEQDHDDHYASMDLEDRLEAALDGRNCDDDQAPSCAYCGADVEGANEPAHTIKNGATQNGRHVDTTACQPCYLQLKAEDHEAFVELCRKAQQHTWSMIEAAPTASMRTQAYEIHQAIGSMALEAQR
jgi:hypothetical protein